MSNNHAIEVQTLLDNCTLLLVKLYTLFFCKENTARDRESPFYTLNISSLRYYIYTTFINLLVRSATKSNANNRNSGVT